MFLPDGAMKRWMYRSQLKEGFETSFLLELSKAGKVWQSELRQRGVMSGSVFERMGDLFLYFETEGEHCEWEWPDGCRAMMETWPGSGGKRRYAVPMLDIFHDGEPSEVRDGQIDRERIGMLARLKPELYGSYIFYHYALQEEKPNSFNPTYTIGTHEDLIFSYHERPTPAFEHGATRRTWPAPIAPENWHDMMKPHFIPWSEGEQGPELWTRMTTLLTF
ncbi:hypothetical protein A8709_14415 [Paenibacillus pectinilyticus]|uniref:Uncharacterized protein n=1 Tax=Paenibacillus pectinilyticus TaxID=512399 RepID=A0A1C1A3Z9_9BACL|nr:hypothetical protein [Paenibacillus pectinilyticus]OCT15287.1 hypothetical protein A8709_14415 [Paenibacillus pectinilyticus]